MDPCKSYYMETVSRVEKVVADKYPKAYEAVPERFWDCLMANHRQAYDKMKANEREMEQHWLNGNMEEMKKFCMAWAKDYLELYRLFALHARREAA